MVKVIGDSPCQHYKDGREITLYYDSLSNADKEILVKIMDILLSQPSCFNCKNFYKESCFGNYQCCSCKIHGNLEVVGNPHYDCDASKCEDYVQDITK